MQNEFIEITSESKPSSILKPDDLQQGIFNNQLRFLPQSEINGNDSAHSDDSGEFLIEMGKTDYHNLRATSRKDKKALSSKSSQQNNLIYLPTNEE